MCGITGILYKNSSQEDNTARQLLLNKMIVSLLHRGPDAKSYYNDEHCYLGFTRLAFVGGPSSMQPLQNESKSIFIICNGEIYNYKELTNRLKKKGHKFLTLSDCEVILHLYEEVGEDVVYLLNGQFAFVLWDKKRKKIFAARDKFGICPLFYSFNSNRLIFASEIKAISNDPSISLSLDPIGVAETALFYAPTPPRTCFNQINRLPPGYNLTLNINDWEINVKQYWSLTKVFSKSSLSKKQDIRSLKEHLTYKIKKAVKTYAMHGDRPVALSISGGIDSSALAYFAHTFPHQIKDSFGIKFIEKKFDETSYQNKLVNSLHLNHHVMICNNEMIRKTLPQVVWHTECPLFRTAPIPLFSFSRFINKSGFNSVLSGEGADELFSGYPVFFEAKVRSILLNKELNNKLLKKQLENFLQRDVTYAEFENFREKYSTPNGLLKRFLSHHTRWQNTKQLLNLFNDDYLPKNIIGRSLKDLRQFLGNDKKMTVLEWAQWIEIITKQEGYILSTQGDRVFMAHAVEKRMPYLDEEVVSYAFKIHEDFKQQGENDKYILRETMRGILPEEIVNRPKQGYLAPNDKPFSKRVKNNYVEELMSPESIKEIGIFKLGEVQKIRSLVENNFSDKNNFIQSAYVFILTTQVLHSKFVKKNTSNY